MMARAKRGKGRGHKAREGAGNQKRHREPTRTEKAIVDHCYLCGKDLTKKEARMLNHKGEKG